MNTTIKKISLVPMLMIAFFAFSLDETYGQRKNEEEIRKIQDAKIAIITNRLDLTPDQSKDFWPIYNEFSKQRRDFHRSMRQLISGKEGARTDDQVMSNLKEVQDLKQKELELEKEYQSKFLGVITANQLVELYKAERSFNEMLIQRLR
jgi:Spy/CpxP family protein refolding chaperone